MTQPMFFQRRPEVVQAIQITKDNHEAIRAFIKGSPYPLWDFEYFSGLWVVKDSQGSFSTITDEQMRKSFIQQNETL